MINHPDRAFTAQEIAEQYDKTRQWGHNQLTSLEDSGHIRSKNPGGRSRFYWVTDAGKRYAWADEEPDSVSDSSSQ